MSSDDKHSQFSFFARFWMAASALGFAVLLLAVSLIVTSQALSVDDPSMSMRRLYFASDVLPDHVLYPVFMAFDRIKLETATPEERLYLSVVYGLRRWEHALDLLEKNEHALAYSTLTKSQLYLLSASNQARDLELSEEARAQLAAVLHEQVAAVRAVVKEYELTAHADILLDINQQLLSAAEQLE